ncbi:glycyl-tRNA synthetase beta chain [Palleronia marisminoris]|uniref:Glycine--tRNA ligase beta subunit n=1 Tax=Palleronia marisminoris TaxID=315423 RepID=A0A1Y5SF56_9RHOB|nr:glycine--tRNA ligase subunit beta [Palleronia marisminoris]SFG80096.1 glycyl-tRNA synthetase beta chain [Palleronia marisminoris]SLN39414.1 Glycine--tRNA ligase beta subunit [Palleronia marisminoris]
MPDLLIELFSEEIPARMQARAADDLKRLVTDGLVEAGLTYAHAGTMVTPRRLTLALEGLTDRSPDTVEERKGPKVGAPDKAIEGFLRGAGVIRDVLEVRADKKGETYFARIEKKGRPAPEIVAEVVEATVRGFPWPKSMRWGAGSLRWVRPLHRIVCILTRPEGHEVVPLDIDGIVSSDVTEGHRFMAPGEIRVRSFEDYQHKLKRAFVMLSPDERAETIRADAANLAFAAGLEVVEDAGLLAEVAGLVEWPVTLMGTIDEQFLDLPPEVLQTSMREHQKFFSVREPGSGRIVRFVTVANRETADDGATILNGNQRVLSARLADAAFFWKNDLAVAKAGMGAWTRNLKSVTFHAKLGSEADRVERIAALARELAPVVGANADEAEQAARLAKADLTSEMVYEFPELQGIMGRYYAKSAGFDDVVADAVAEHYAPLGPSDTVPTAPVSVAVSLAEKLDKLTGFWAIDEKPTGSKDPYALRRAALGVIRLILTNDLRLAIFGLLDESIRIERRHDRSDGLAEFDHRVLVGDLMEFFEDRLKVHLRDEGIPHDVIDACLAMPNADDLTLLVKRARALAAFMKTEDGTNLVQGFKRANNILTQAEEKDGVEYSFGADAKHAHTDEERALFAALDQQEPVIEKAMTDEDFGAAMTSLALLRPPIDVFFESVQINADNQILRRNRLNLLSRIRTLCLGVADLTRIEG